MRLIINKKVLGSLALLIAGCVSLSPEKPTNPAQGSIGGTGTGASMSTTPGDTSPPPALNDPKIWESIRRVIVIVLENTDYNAALEMPYLKSLAQKGALLTQFYAVTHPSQPNYIAMIAGNPYTTSNSPVNLDAKHIGDLLEAKGMSWKLYAEDFPGNCYLEAFAGNYSRKHVPFLSFKSVTSDQQRCKQVTSADEFDADYKAGRLPELTYYVPNNRNNGHDTGPQFADLWLRTRFGQILNPDQPGFDSGTLFVITYDEGSYRTNNQIYTVLIGPQVKPGSRSNRKYTHYSLLATLEKIFKLPSLGQKDVGAALIDDPQIWKNPLN